MNARPCNRSNRTGVMFHRSSTKQSRSSRKRGAWLFLLCVAAIPVSYVEIEAISFYRYSSDWNYSSPLGFQFRLSEESVETPTPSVDLESATEPQKAGGVLSLQNFEPMVERPDPSGPFPQRAGAAEIDGAPRVSATAKVGRTQQIAVVDFESILVGLLPTVASKSARENVTSQVQRAVERRAAKGDIALILDKSSKSLNDVLIIIRADGVLDLTEEIREEIRYR